MMAEVNTTTFTDASVSPDALYRYAVAALNAGGEGPRTEAILVSPGVQLVPPGPPLHLRAEVDDNTVTLRWDPPAFDGGAPVTGYAVLRGPSKSELREFALVGDVRKYVDGDLLHEETYVYAVRAINEVGMGEVSKAVTVETNGGGAIMAPDSPALWLVFCLVPVLLVAGAFSASEPFRYSLLILLLPLFSRLHRKEVLDNKTRFAILGIIMERPGIHYSALREEFGLSNGGAAHHLDVLERENFIRAVSDGRKKRFYTVHTKVPEKRRMTPEEIREAVVDLVASRPGISQLQVIEQLGVDRDTVGYHLRTLVREDVLDARRKGRYTVYTVNGRR
jgi:DNA-binding MarR family transcriptional regulator